MRRWFRRILCLIGIMILGVLLLGTQGGLTYFSPFTLEIEGQSEFAIWGGSLPVYRSPRRPVHNELVTFLLEEGFVERVQPESQRWDLVFHWNRAWKDGHCTLYEVLVRYRRSIIEWSRADRERARIYWSEGFRYLRSDRKSDIAIGHVILADCWRCESIPELRERIAVLKAEIETPPP